jgi:hypothetical protein
MTYFEPTDESTNRDNRFILILSTTDREPPLPIGLPTHFISAASRLNHRAGLLYSL